LCDQGWVFFSPHFTDEEMKGETEIISSMSYSRFCPSQASLLSQPDTKAPNLTTHNVLLTCRPSTKARRQENRNSLQDRLPTREFAA
jgi:hypothetical protein